MFFLSFLLKVDVSKHNEVVNLRERIKEDLGVVNILINNAAIFPVFSLLEGPSDEVQRLINVNLLGHIWVIGFSLYLFS